jgi:hypothetical protein
VTKKERKDSLEGRWPVADPIPRIITLLRELVEPSMPADIQLKARAEAQAIVGDWYLSENLDDLKKALGLILPRGRRRTQHTVIREWAIALQVYELQARGDSKAIENVASQVSADVKHVRRCMDRWANAKQMVTAARESTKGANTNYLAMLD